MKINLKHAFKFRGSKLLLEVIVIIVLFSIVKLYLQRDLATGTPPQINESLLSGEKVDEKTFRGKPTLLHFWATWCKVCKLEENSISDLSKTHHVITVAMKSGTAQQVGQYLIENNLSYSVINDKHGLISKKFGVNSVPTSFILNSDGKIQFTEVGFTSNWGLRLRLWMAQGD